MSSFMPFPTTQQVFFLPGPAGQLEVMTAWPKQPTVSQVAIICHPHPLGEGTMHNKVVTTLAKAFDQLDYATVRFNFRGVGDSAGVYGDGIGEIADLQAIIAWVRQALPDATITLAGFSFGSYISAYCAQEGGFKQLVNIAPAVNHFDFSSLAAIDCPWLVIQGDADEIVPVNEVITFAKHPPAPLELIVLPGVGHFFHGKLIELRTLIIDKLM